MFNKYLRYYPWWMQLILLVVMLFIFGNFAYVLCWALVPKLYGVSLQQVVDMGKNSSGPLVQAALFFQGFSHVCIFLFPALIFAYLCHPRPAFYLGLKKPAKILHAFWVLIIVAGAIPVFMGLLALMQHIHLGKWADDMQQRIDDVQGPFLTITNIQQFLSVLFVMAILPALGEEMLFRGIMLRFARKRSSNMLFPLIITALIFALIHFSIYGFVSIFLAGLILGLIYYLTGSLWYSILFHFLNNGVQVYLEYLGHTNTHMKAVLESNTLPAYIPIVGILLLALGFWGLYQSRSTLPPGWQNDFSPDETDALFEDGGNRL
jgi:hypothetical protein